MAKNFKWDVTLTGITALLVMIAIAVPWCVGIYTMWMWLPN